MSVWVCICKVSARERMVGWMGSLVVCVYVCVWLCWS